MLANLNVVLSIYWSTLIIDELLAEFLALIVSLTIAQIRELSTRLDELSIFNDLSDEEMRQITMMCEIYIYI